MAKIELSIYAVSPSSILNSAEPVVPEDGSSNIPWDEKGEIEIEQSGSPKLVGGPLIPGEPEAAASFFCNEHFGFFVFFPLGGDKSWLDSTNNPFIRRMSHGPTPLTTMIEQDIMQYYIRKCLIMQHKKIKLSF
uniref:Similar to ATMUS81 n=1 Tax=Arundo donax TaxID=35708 RepID=A0A0A9HII0_ARUDO